MRHVLGGDPHHDLSRAPALDGQRAAERRSRRSAGAGKYLSYWQYSFSLAQIAVPAFFAGLFDVRADLTLLVLAGLSAVAAVSVLALERSLRGLVRA